MLANHVAFGWWAVVPRFVLLLLSCVVAAPGVAHAGNAEEELHAFIGRGISDWKLTGLAIVVVKDDKVVFLRGYGMRDLRTGAAVDEHTAFQIGSCTKPLAASAVALLIQDGKIAWDTPLVEKWAGFRVADPVVTRQATIRDALSHRTGVGKDESTLYYQMPMTRTELLQRLPEVQQAAPFRTEWRYSSLMYSAVGRVVEEITGESWDDYIARRIFGPLGMVRTHTSLRSLMSSANVAVPHVRVKGETLATDFADQDNLGPAAAISASATDLSHWLLMMVNEGRHQGRPFLKPDLVREMIKPHVLMPFADPTHGAHNFNAYGLGLMLCDYQGLRIAKHAGMAGHSLAMLGFVPERRVGVAVLTNHRPCLFHYAVFRRALDLYCDMPLVDLESANKKLLAEHQARQEQTRKRLADAHNPSNRPTLSLPQYVGVYEREHGLRAKIEADAKGLVLRYGRIVADVTHWHGDTFRAVLRERRLEAEQDWYLTFTLSKRRITKLHVDSEHDIRADFRPVK